MIATCQKCGEPVPVSVSHGPVVALYRHWISVHRTVPTAEEAAEE